MPRIESFGSFARFQRVAVTLLMITAAATLAACGHSSVKVQPVTPVGGALARLAVSPAAVTFTAAGASQSLRVRGYDAAGVEVAVTGATFTSSDGTTASVDANGLVRAVADLGSSLIDVRVGSIVAPPVTVLALHPAAGVILVADDEVTTQPVVVSNAGVAHVRTSLSGVAGVSIGSLLLGTGTMPVSGRVTSVTTTGSDTTVELEDVPITTLVRDLSMDLTYTSAQVNAYTTQLDAPAAATALAAAGTRHPSLKSLTIGAFTCDSALDLSILQGEFEGSLSPPDVSFHIAHTVVDSQLTITTVVATGGLKADLKGVFRLGATVTGEVDCKMPLGRLVAPVFGVASVIAAPSIPLNVEFDLTAEVSYAGFSFGGTGSVGADVELGFNWFSSGSGSQVFQKFDTTGSFDRVVSVPTDQGPRAKLKLFGGFSSGMDLSFGNVGVLSLTRLELVKVTAGPEFEARLAGPYTAAGDPSFQTGYELKAKVEVGPGADIEKVIEELLLSPKAIDFSIKVELPLSQSPTAATLQVERASGPFSPAQDFAAGEALTFRIELDPAHIGFAGLAYNVSEVRVYRLDYGTSTATLVASASPSTAGQTSFVVPWTADGAGVLSDGSGRPTFYAFVVDVPFQAVTTFAPLELGALTNDSIPQQVIAGTGTSSMRVLADGRIAIRGTNNAGALGTTGVAIGATATGPVYVDGITDAISVSGGAWHGVALTRGGDVYAWGWGAQIGVANVNNPTPFKVAGNLQAKAISSSYNSTLVLLKDGSVWGFGVNTAGSLGPNGGSLPSDTGLGPAKAVAAGNLFSLALHADGTVWAIGTGIHGELGDGNGQNSSVPVQVKGLTGVVAIAAGAYHGLALTADGQVWAWGANGFGQLGTGIADGYHLVPAQVTGLVGVTKIAAGEGHSLAIANGVVYTWGLGNSGQLGTGDFFLHPAPAAVLTGAVDIDGAEFNSLALMADGSVYGWGYNYFGQIADSPTGSASALFPTPIQITNLQ